ncbi:hypothetical protein LTR78_009347 [Recurvomyces mirabilis]|uniref:Uncharacterized protein n=1 Tax=Recurvomyces mirabilis TaxID=574656 RepID=A0AAE0TPI9_9PEZI|nr:hypothetical protein LTR78_009347 [Recurvomyces mirabilis]
MASEDLTIDSPSMSWLETPTTDEDLHDSWDSMIIPEEETMLRGRSTCRATSPSRHSRGDHGKLALAIQAVIKAKDAVNETLGVMREAIVTMRKATECLHEINSYQKLASVPSKRKH